MKGYMPTRLRMWGELSVDAHDGTEVVVESAGVGLGFFVVFASREEAEAASPGVTILEIEFGVDERAWHVLEVQGEES